MRTGSFKHYFATISLTYYILTACKLSLNI